MLNELKLSYFLLYDHITVGPLNHSTLYQRGFSWTSGKLDS
jgi:hypothetical protein